jgi:hypothetical protein
VVQPGKGTALAVRLMPGLYAIWNYRDFLDWIDQRVSFGLWTQPDPCAPYDGAGWNGTSVDMSKYGITFGPDGHGDCIRDNNPADGIGRFPSLHGTAKDQGLYGSNFITAMWNGYRNTVGLERPFGAGAPSGRDRHTGTDVYPNPARGPVVVALPEAPGQATRLGIYDRCGRLVQNIVSPAADVNRALRLQWDGIGVNGRRITPGMYFYTVTVGSRRETGRIVVLP